MSPLPTHLPGCGHGTQVGLLSLHATMENDGFGASVAQNAQIRRVRSESTPRYEEMNDVRVGQAGERTASIEVGLEAFCSSPVSIHGCARAPVSVAPRDAMRARPPRPRRRPHRALAGPGAEAVGEVGGAHGDATSELVDTEAGAGVGRRTRDVLNADVAQRVDPDLGQMGGG